MRTACKLDDAGIELFARTGTGVAHCPCSNMRLASGIAPIRRDASTRACRWAWASTASASNDGAQMVGEVRQALLLQRVGFGPDAMTAREALEIATLGGAKVLGRDDIGALAPGMAADFVSFDLRQPLFAGALHDPVAALVFCAPSQVIDERDRRQGGRAGRAVDDARTRTGRRAAQPAGEDALRSGGVTGARGVRLSAARP